MYVYHYYAQKQIITGEIKHIDGIILRQNQFSGDWEEYQKLKNDIDDEKGDKLIICSLTLIGTMR